MQTPERNFCFPCNSAPHSTSFKFQSLIPHQAAQSTVHTGHVVSGSSVRLLGIFLTSIRLSHQHTYCTQQQLNNQSLLIMAHHDNPLIMATIHCGYGLPQQQHTHVHSSLHSSPSQQLSNQARCSSNDLQLSSSVSQVPRVSFTLHHLTGSIIN